MTPAPARRPLGPTTPSVRPTGSQSDSILSWRAFLQRCFAFKPVGPVSYLTLKTVPVAGAINGKRSIRGSDGRRGTDAESESKQLPQTGDGGEQSKQKLENAGFDQRGPTDCVATFLQHAAASEWENIPCE